MYKFDRNRFYSFNLLTPKSELDILVIKERNNVFFGSFILIFFSFFFFLVISILEYYVVDFQIRDLQSKISSQEANISLYEDLKVLYGEFIYKTNLLEEPVKKEINIKNLLYFGDLLVSNLENVIVRSFNRAEDGLFTMSVEFDQIDDIQMIFKNASSIKNVENLYLVSTSFIESFNKYTANLSFYINSYN